MKKLRVNENKYNFKINILGFKEKLTKTQIKNEIIKRKSNFPSNSSFFNNQICEDFKEDYKMMVKINNLYENIYQISEDFEKLGKNNCFRKI